MLLPGNVVEVRAWSEILTSLDAQGMLEALPFMPEMMKFCGRKLTVSKRLERTCEETRGEMRRICNTLFLEDLRCDGTAHDNCQKGCVFFWKEAWLKDASQQNGEVPHTSSSEEFPFPTRAAGGEYVCQSTELIRATAPLPWHDPRYLLRDIVARTYTPLKLSRALLHAGLLRVRSLMTGRSYRFIKGTNKKTPSESLNLRPGEMVRVKSLSEIAATVDQDGKNRGLAFTVEMLPFCGRTFRVLRRLDRMILDPTRKMLELRNTVILENVICDGCHILRGGCPRENFHYWREIWLTRVSPETESHSVGSADS
jgi:hypothetical protein